MLFVSFWGFTFPITQLDLLNLSLPLPFLPLPTPPKKLYKAVLLPGEIKTMAEAASSSLWAGDPDIMSRWHGFISVVYRQDVHGPRKQTLRCAFTGKETLSAMPSSLYIKDQAFLKQV